MMTEQEHSNVQWKKVKLGEVGDFYVGGDVDRSCFSPYPTVECRFPIYANALVNEGLYGFSSKYEFDKEAITITGRGEVGKVFYRKPYFSTIIRLVTLIPTDSNIDVKFLSYAMSRINFIIESTGVPQLTAPQAKKYEVSIPYQNGKPDLPAQRRIAAILASADKVIAATQKTIAKYKQIKQGMMEDLLNEQCTMNNVQWVHKTLIELADYHNGMAFKPSDWVNDGVKIIRIEQLNNPLGKYDYYQGVFPETSAIHNGDLIFSWSATLKVVIWQWGDGVLNQHLFKVVPASNVDKHFLYYLLDYNMPKLGESSHGSTMKHIKRKELETHTVYIPRKIAEQKRIASILSSIDSKIECEQSVLNKYIQVKKGLMEKLLNEKL